MGIDSVSLPKPTFSQNSVDANCNSVPSLDLNTVYEIFSHLETDLAVRAVCKDWKKIYGEERLKGVWERQFSHLPFYDPSQKTFDESVRYLTSSTTNVKRGKYTMDSIDLDPDTCCSGVPQCFQHYILFPMTTKSKVDSENFTPTLFELWNTKENTIEKFNTAVLFKEYLFFVKESDGSVVRRNLLTQKETHFNFPYELCTNISHRRIFATDRYLFFSYSKEKYTLSMNFLEHWWTYESSNCNTYPSFKLFSDMRNVVDHPTKLGVVIIQDGVNLQEMDVTTGQLTNLLRFPSSNLYPLSYLEVTEEFVLSKRGRDPFCDLVFLGREKIVYEGNVINLVSPGLLALKKEDALVLYDYKKGIEVASWMIKKEVMKVTQLDQRTFLIDMIENAESDENGCTYVYEKGTNDPIQHYKETFHSHRLSPKKKSAPTSPVHSSGKCIKPTALKPMALNFSDD